ncbi:MAG: hypothetical protein J6D15_00425 [Clostridia bacterium]|nr:hypothetical protein [Clostridia bacterium]
MKKVRALIIALICVSLLAACGTRNQPAQSSESSNIEGDVSKQEVIWAEKLPYEISKWHEVTRYTGDTDGDGSDENVVLLTSAEYDEDGEFFWNDGQNWALFVEDRGENYLLLNEYLNAGSVYFEVLDLYMEEGTKPQINVIVSTTSGFSLTSYAFSKDEDGYVVVPQYDSGAATVAGTNRRFSSIPEY